MEEIRTKYRTISIGDIMDPIRYPESTFDPEPTTIPELFIKNAQLWKTYPAIVSKEDRIYTYQDYYAMSVDFARSLIAIGCKKTDVICIIGFTSPEYLFSLQGSWMIGCVCAGIYTTNSPDACKYVLQHSESVLCVCEGGSNAVKIASISDTLPHLRDLVVYWPQSGVPPMDENGVRIHTWNAFMELGRRVNTEEVMGRMKRVQPGNCCSLIYTSGTTGNPKGVMISHDNATFNAQSSRSYLQLDDNDRFVSYLPMNHIAAQFFDVMIPICNRATVYMASPDALQRSLQSTLVKAKPTFFLAVPRVWEKFSESIHRDILSSSRWKQRFITWCRKIGQKVCLSHQFNQKPQHHPFFFIADRFCFQKTKRLLGIEHSKTLIVCAAPVVEDTLTFYASFNIPLLDLYGQSEATAPVSFNTHLHQQWRLFTSGRPIPGVECRVDPNTSELQYRGRNVMMGYYKLAADTVATIDEEGWVHTGDQARIDEDGFVQMTGRLKELIITSGGENISPVPIELKILELCPALSNCIVIGDKRKFLSCLLSLKVITNPITGEPTKTLLPVAITHLESIGSHAKTVDAAKTDPLVIKMINDTIDEYNNVAVSRAQNIRKWALLDSDLSLSGGELTATLKLRRGVVQEKYMSCIDSLYN